MILWMVWTLAFSGLVALAATAFERIAAYFAMPRRYGWMVAIGACAVVPLVLATRGVERARDVAPAAVPLVPSAPVLPPRMSAAAIVPPSDVMRSVRRATVVTASADFWAVGGWAAMSAIVLFAFVRATRLVRRRSASWREADVAECRALIARDAGPAVVGFVHPRIVMPEWALSLERRTQEIMLRHELEHIRTGDPRALVGAGVALVTFPWNAALWWMVRRLRLAMEIDCDARVIHAIGGSHDYGMVLLAVGERYATPLPLAASLAGPRPFLEWRINAMTMTRPRRPLLASMPFLAAALVVLTAATSAPRPASLSTIAQLRGPKPFPTRADIHVIIGENFPEIASGKDKVNCIVLVFDADNNYVRGIPAMRGPGSVMIEVDGDTLASFLDRRQRTALRTGVPINASLEAGAGGSGGGGRGGRGGGSGASSGGENATIQAQGSVSLSGSATGKPENYATFYSHGWSMVSMDSMMAGVHPAINQAPGLTPPVKGGASGIEGIPASQLASIESMAFGAGQLAPASVQVLAVFLVPNTKKPVQ